MYRAYQPELDRLVAVKMFRLDVPPERVHQLVAELEKLIAADLTHPAIAAPLAAGIAGKAAYLAQDFVAADSIDIVVRDYGPAPPADAVRVATQVAGALDFAAVVNITHGALHPRDVLVSPEDTRITGLGIARALEQIGVGAAVRRPYTAPERAAGRAWDRRADVFSLAAVVFELLFGRRIAGTGEQAREAVTDLLGANVRQLRAVFARALAEEPADRFDTALEFAEQLKGAFADHVLVAPPPVEIASDAAVTPPVETAGAAATAPPPIGAEVEPSASPLDEPTPGRTFPIAALPFAREHETVRDLDLRNAEAARYEDVESAPSAPEPMIAASLEPSGSDDEQGVPTTVPPHAARVGVWAIALALLLGAGIGATMAMVLVNRNRPAGPRGFTETAVVAPAPPPAERVEPPAQEIATPPALQPVTETPKPTDQVNTTEPERRQPEPTAIAPPRSVQQPAQSAVADSGRILVRSTPAGARVFLDGKDVGITPQTLRDLARGSHVVRVSRDGYTTEERRVSITAARPAQSITVELSRQRLATDRRPTTPVPATPGTVGRFTGSLIVDSRPSGATVFVDGRQVGTTPVALETVDAGSHAVRIDRDGYRRWTSAVRVVAGEKNRVTASLER